MRSPSVLLRVSLLLVASVLVPQQTRTAGSPREQTATVRGLEEIAAHALSSRRSSSNRVAQFRALRGNLLELQRGLDALERDPSPSRAEELLDRRQAAKGRFEALRGKPRHRGATGLPLSVERQIRDLWYEVDSVAIDPIGQRMRFARARGRIEEALAQPPQEKALAMAVSVPVLNDVPR